MITTDFDADSVDTEHLVVGTQVNIANDLVGDSSINWNYEWIYLTDVYGFNRALGDSIFLYDRVQKSGVDSLWLFVDTSGDLQTANYDDTVSVGGYVPYACTIDSLRILYSTNNTSTLVDTGFFKINDTLVETHTTNLATAAWTETGMVVDPDVALNAGDRLSYTFHINFDAADRSFKVAWIRARVRR